MKQVVGCALFVFFLATLTAVAAPARPAGDLTSLPAVTTCPDAPAVPASPAPPSIPQAAALRERAVELLLDSKFSPGLEALERALELDPADRDGLKMRAWVDEHLERLEASRRQRHSQYATAVEKAKRLSRIARAGDDDLPAETLETVREKLTGIQETTLGLLAAARSEGGYSDAEWFDQRLTDDLATIRTGLDEAAAIIGDNVEERAKQLREGILRGRVKLEAFEQAARGRSWATPRQGRESLDAIETQVDDLIEVLVYDLGALATENPWLAALDRVRVTQAFLV